MEGRLEPPPRIDIMPEMKSCVAPAMMLPIGIIQKTMSPNFTPMITPITGPIPAILSSWISIFFQRGRIRKSTPSRLVCAGVGLSSGERIFSTKCP